MRMNMKKISIAVMMFAVMVLLAACGAAKEKDENTSSGHREDIQYTLANKVQVLVSFPCT